MKFTTILGGLALCALEVSASPVAELEKRSAYCCVEMSWTDGVPPLYEYVKNGLGFAVVHDFGADCMAVAVQPGTECGSLVYSAPNCPVDTHGFKIKTVGAEFCK
ncbi:hypothetical protein E4U21_007293 [Claviceps maximensis]|nr:hypothetical protein E4U21_007293 [Claviceps maximensis]